MTGDLCMKLEIIYHRTTYPSILYHEDCKLCKIYQDDLEHEVECKVLRIVPSKDCPCLLCLLKGICSDTCEEYDKTIKDGRERKLVE